MAVSPQSNSFSLLDFILGRFGGREGPVDNYGFLFAETSGQTNAGENVNVDSVLSEPTTMSCINIISQGITQIPMCVKRKTADGGFEIIDDHPVKMLLQRPNVYQTPSDFKYSIVETILVHGNCYIRVIRSGNPEDGMDTSGQPVQLVPMDPVDVTVGANAFGIPTYYHETYGSIAAENVIHIRDLNTFTANGLSRVLLASEIIGAKIAADRLMSETFRYGVSLNYAITSDGVMQDAETKEHLQRQLSEAFGVGGRRRGGAILLENANMQAIKGSTPADADLRELRQELKNEIAGVLRVPSFMIGGTGADKYNNVRQRLSSFHRDTLQPIIQNIEEAMTLRLIDSMDESVYFDIRDFIKGDFENQAQVASTLVSNGIWTPNEGREYMNTNRHDSEIADELIPPNSTVNTNLEEPVPANATGGSDGPQGEDNA